MRILIYGAGAVGCFIGGHLAQAGHDVTLLGRSWLAEAVQKHGLAIKQADGSTFAVKQIRVATTLAEAFAQKPAYDWAAFTMKAYDTVRAIFDLQTLNVEVPLFVSFQNGIGNEESLQSAFGEDNVIAGTLTSPVSMPEPGVVVEEKARGIALAADNPQVGVIMDAFRQTALPFQRVQSSDSLKWSKLLLNMVGNATAAILDMTPCEVFHHPQLYEIEQAALSEAIAMMKLQNIPAVNLPSAPAKMLVTMRRVIPRPVLRPLLTQQVCKGRGEKLPSLLAALRAGHRQTEVAWLNGAVVKSADSLKRLAPINHVLALTLSDITAGRAPWEMFRGQPEMLITAVRVVLPPGKLSSRLQS